MNPPESNVPASAPPVAVQVLIWTLWVLEVIAFLYLFGCATLFQFGGFSGKPGYSILGILGLVVSLGLFIFALKLSFESTPNGGRRALAGGAVMLLAGFIVFGSCTLAMQ